MLTATEMAGCLALNRKVRAWHWAEMQRLRKEAKAFQNTRKNSFGGKPIGENIARVYDEMANTHLKCVQLMNDLPGCDETTAEQDWKLWRP